jgi:hypothetical protein
MREQDMRLRIERFLKARLRNMLRPAALGLGLALGGCDSDGLTTDDGGDPATKQDAAANTDVGAVTKYMAPTPDAGLEIPIGAPEYIAPILKEDAGIAVRYMAQMPADAGPELGGAVAMYIAPMP